MSSPYLIFLEVALVALALWLHSDLFSLVTFIVLSYFTPKYMYDKTIQRNIRGPFFSEIFFHR